MAVRKKETSLDIVNYFLIPPVRVLSDKEKKKVFDKYGVGSEHFPKILESDPLAKALKLKVGDVIEIKRDDGTGEYLAYRVCVSSSDE